MAAQREADRELKSELFKKPKEDIDDNEIVLKVRSEEDLFFIEIEIPRDDMTMKKLTTVIKEEFEIAESVVLILKKMPDVLIRKDKDVWRLRNGQELEIVPVE